MLTARGKNTRNMKCVVRAAAFGGALGLILLVFSAQGAGIAFPGLPPGRAKASDKKNMFTLENAVLAATWQASGGTLRPFRVTNKLTEQQFDQVGTELFRLALQPSRPQASGVRVAVRFSDDQVVALASKDDAAWVELAAFPRADFPGEPKAGALR